jgi:hypothetical protein
MLTRRAPPSPNSQPWVMRGGGWRQRRLWALWFPAPALMDKEGKSKLKEALKEAGLTTDLARSAKGSETRRGMVFRRGAPFLRGAKAALANGGTHAQQSIQTHAF